MTFNKKGSILILFVLILMIAACSNSEVETAESGEGKENSSVESDEVEENSSVESEGNAGNEESSDSLTIQFGIVEPDGHSVTEGAYKFEEIVETKSDGAIQVDVYPNQQLGSMREQTEMTQMGTVELSIAPISTVSSFVNDLQVLELPFLFTEEGSMWEILDGEVGQDILTTMDDEGFNGMGLWAGGFKHMTSHIEPILSPNELDGLNIRVIPSDLLIEQYETWGANPTPIDFAELYTSLQQGVVDAQENPLVTILSQKYYEVQDYLTLTNHSYQFHVMMANKDWFNNLEPDVQELLIEAEKEARQFSREMNSEQNEQYLQELKDHGLEVYELEDDAIKEFQELSEPIYENNVQTESQEELFNSIQNAIDSY